MKKKGASLLAPRTTGFEACYKGKTIASAESFEKLAHRAEVKKLLGNKELLIRHTVPEGMIAVY